MSNRVLVIRDAVPDDVFAAARDYIRRVPIEDYEPYTHPFEPKLQLPKAHYSAPPLQELLMRLRGTNMRAAFSGSFDLPFPLLKAGPDYFTAFYLYRPGDYLQMHLDTVLHGEDRKVVTLNYYFDACEGGEFLVGPLDNQSSIPSAPNLLVAMTNDDEAYHCVEPIRSGTRLMVTTSFVMPVEAFPREGFTNTHRKAWFVPKHGEAWTEEQFRLRNERAGLVLQ